MSRQSRSPTDCCQLSNILAPPLFAITDQSLITILERCPPPKPPSHSFFFPGEAVRSRAALSKPYLTVTRARKSACLEWKWVWSASYQTKSWQRCDMSIVLVVLKSGACAAYLMPSGDGASSPIALQEVSSLCNLRRVISITAACSHAPPR